MARKLLYDAATQAKRIAARVKSPQPDTHPAKPFASGSPEDYWHYLPNERADLIIRQAAAVEASIDGVAILDADFCIVYVNPAFCFLLGYRLDEYLVEQPWQVFISRTSLRLVKNTVFRSLQNSHRWRGEILVKSRDGGEIPVELSIVKIDANSYSCITRDVSERKRQQRTIHETELKYQTLVDMSQDGVYVMQDGKFIYVNEAFANSIGYLKSDIVGLCPRDLVASRYRRKTVDTVLRSANKAGKDRVVNAFVVVEEGAVEHRQRRGRVGAV